MAWMAPANSRSRDSGRYPRLRTVGRPVL